ncbi:hypothetical protein KOY_02846 [Bacillus cereus VDM021]|uniref:Uncharacterized protein n=2 Tax=Bacillus pseudomycoides TaxID=64104 RepID=A0A1Y3MN46_9BACI|nr:MULTISPECIES: hypothetical protein [Bacillus cereus group]EOP53422.1 hypothetical protein IIW_01958 [Bacillus cereus VD136]EOP68415.1 hypothetical protein KOW_03624 [Bacillus cereus VDM006]EOQ05060.1 hypothetical protein KOY_02846 [Bacillus cereus VDM021]MDF2084867.1 hypothetical protein [Bacillus pseudomycoides]OUM50291.1 hypothetical protein BW425_04235 [Bacillus pseudomycoides]
MSIKVIRATGMMGGATRVALKVDNEVIMKLENNEEYTLPSDVKEAKLKANQLFFGSKEKQVKSGDIVEIKINSIAMLLYMVSLIAVLFGSKIDPNVIWFGVIGSLVSLVYSINNWFTLEVK